jgi:hypothetical protein
MEENEQLEEAGNKVSTGEEKEERLLGPDDQEIEAAGEIGIPEANTEGSATDSDQDNETSLSSDAEVGPTENGESIPDISKVKENPDPEPGVPDQDF